MTYYYKTYHNVAMSFDIWEVIEDMAALGLRVIGVTKTSITIAKHESLTFKEIDRFMSNRGFI